MVKSNIREEIMKTDPYSLYDEDLNGGSRRFRTFRSIEKSSKKYS
jgi:hypothetical protein